MPRRPTPLLCPDACCALTLANLPPRCRALALKPGPPPSSDRLPLLVPVVARPMMVGRAFSHQLV